MLYLFQKVLTKQLLIFLAMLKAIKLLIKKVPLFPGDLILSYSAL